MDLLSKYRIFVIYLNKYTNREDVSILQTDYDVIISGAGAAGLYGALNLDESLNVLLACKRELTLCNSSLAQGGVAAVVYTDDDSPDLHMNDTFIAGGFKNDPKSLKVLVNDGPEDVKNLLKLGADFDKTPDGKYHLTLEGGHSRHRIFHHADCTGREIVETLIKQVKARSNITIAENCLVSDIKQVPNGFCLNLLQNGEFTSVCAPFCMLCTGGIGRVYEYTTNSAIATGDGIAFAYNMGAEIKNLHLVQFHPTAFSNAQRECFLISEAVRGEGAYLLNCDGERFMQRYDERLELAPRDVVSRAIIDESKRTQSDKFYLDISRKDAEFIKNRFPMIYKNLLDEGYDLTHDKIPIFPCQHYLMGGIDVDINGKTSIDGLYAAGECSHTGVHGQNRLASNSLLEALVFSHRAADEINQNLKAPHTAPQPCEFDVHKDGKHIPHGVRTEIRHIMQSAHFVVPDKAAANAGYKRICEILKQLETEDYVVNTDFVEAKSLATVAYIILKEVKD